MQKSIHSNLQSPLKTKNPVSILKSPQSIQSKNYISPNTNPISTKSKIQIPPLYDKHTSQTSSRTVTPQGSSRNNKTLLSPNQLRDLLAPKNYSYTYSNNPTPRTPLGSQMAHETLRDSKKIS